MDVELTYKQVVGLPIAERLSFAQRLWQSVSDEIEESAPGDFPEDVRNELDRRVAFSISHPAAAVAWEEVEKEAIAREAQ